MFEEIKRDLTRCKDDQPGTRFCRLHEHRNKSRRSLVSRVGLIGLGAVMFIVGLPMVPGPGPGLVIMLLGLGLLGSEFLPLARFMDRAEVRLRGFFNRLYSWFSRIPPGTVVVASLLITAMVISAGVGGYNLVKDKVPQAQTLLKRN